MSQDLEYDFFAADPQIISTKSQNKLKIIIADDDTDVHHATQMVLRKFVFEGNSLDFIHTYNAAETKQALLDHPDIAVIFLDVVMEENDSGLKLIDYIRKAQQNPFIRILLRTGQPGEAPEESVIVDYDINDYLLKTEMTVQRLFTSLYQALRAYRDIQKIESSRRGLEKVIRNSSKLFIQDSLYEFFSGILQALTDLKLSDSSICFTNTPPDESSLAYVIHESGCKIVAATGIYKTYLGHSLEELSKLENLSKYVHSGLFEGKSDIIEMTFGGFLVWRRTKMSELTFIYIQSPLNQFDIELIQIFLVNYALALDGFMVNRQIMTTQLEIINTLGNTIETRSHETAHHVRRVSEISALLSKKLGLDDADCALIRSASAMHDVGKIGIEDWILTKPGQLTLDEFAIMKRHTEIGYKIFKNSDLPVLQEAATICLYHHERFDGKGYPNGLAGTEIPLSARIVSVADVFDALTHDRCYKKAWSIQETYNYLEHNKGMQFDPIIVECLIAAKAEIMNIFEVYRD